MGLLRAEKPATALGDWTLFLWHEANGIKAALPSGVAIEEVFLVCYYQLA
jgi:hypothetical protein